MFFDFVQPIPKELYHDLLLQNQQLDSNVAFYKLNTEDIETYDIALLGIEDFRGYVENKGTELAPNVIRKKLYSYAPFFEQTKIVDLGNIKAGTTYQDTLVAVAETIKDAFKNNLKIIILGGDISFTLAQYQAYQIFENEIQLTQISSNIDIEDNQEDNYKRYIYDILKTDYLKRYNLVGYQSYFIKKSIQEIIHNYQFDALRVGKIRQNIFEAEPLIREADLVSFDINAIRYSDAPAQKAPSPNGLFGDEACMLARFAGMSDMLNSIGFYNFNPNEDIKGITAHQVAQMVWYFIEGVKLRKQDYPITSEDNFYHYTTSIDSEYFTFLKSKKTERWWMKIPVKRNESTIYHLIPCTYEDYNTARNGEIPEPWMRNVLRLS
ncbi:MAG: arginase family protein [Sphingobacteriales bacterium]|jgi:arginase family enzyme|nr:MAG: arginase family protein [Sphingobacteriales bacterium]